MRKNTTREWLMTAATAKGRGHISRNIVCQDKVLCTCGSGTTVIGLADGAGSAVNSHLGAEKSLEVITNMLIDGFEDIYANPSREQVVVDIMQKVYEGLNQLACEYEVELATLASTLLAAAVRGDRYIYIHLGDGIIGAFKDGKTVMASWPMNGEFANSTVFTTSKDADKYMQLGKGRLGDIEGFVLMSDGSAHSLVQKQQQRFAGMVDTMFRLGKLLPKSHIEHLVQEKLLPLLVDRTTDDCSIAILMRSAKDRISPAMARHLGDIWQYLSKGDAPVQALRQAGIRKKYYPVYLASLRIYGWIK